MPDADSPEAGPLASTIIIVGGDALALNAAHELCAASDHRIVVLWLADPEFAATVAAAGARFVAARPDSVEGLCAAGVVDAVSILALSHDDQLNLQAALRARDTNPRIRIVLRQFNRTLAPKIEQNLPDCSVLSLAWHSAATYAAAALDPSCLRGLQFPEPDGPLTGFATRSAGTAGVAGMTVTEAERHLGARIIALDGDVDVAAPRRLASQARLTVFGPAARLVGSAPNQTPPPRRRRRSGLVRWRGAATRIYRKLRRADPYIASFAAVGTALFLMATWHFRESFGSTWLVAAYFVMSTITTTGYGDITPRHDVIDLLAAMSLMLLGVVFTGIFIAFVAARLTRAQWVRMQGLRPVRRHGHIVVCGCGSIGSGVVDLLLEFDKPLVVIEHNPDASLVERARDRGFDLLTGDASRDDTLDLCNLAGAHSLVALTNVDTLNLEIALGARARNPDMPIVLRIAEAALASSIANHFQLETTFSVAALAGPVFAGLSLMPGARGQIAIGGREFAISEIAMRCDAASALPPSAIPLAIAGSNGACTLARDIGSLRPGSRVLALIPIAPFGVSADRRTAAPAKLAGA